MKEGSIEVIKKQKLARKKRRKEVRKLEETKRSRKKKYKKQERDKKERTGDRNAHNKRKRIRKTKKKNKHTTNLIFFQIQTVRLSVLVQTLTCLASLISSCCASHARRFAA
jgi:hypothetical protein